MALYYYSKLAPKLDRHMKMMIVAITMAFIVRSSSLVGWVPLALFYLFQSQEYFIAILSGAFLVAVPLLSLSILIDSYFYGKLCFPQLNFVYVNVVENVCRHFGMEQWWFLLERIPENVAKQEFLRSEFFQYTFMMYSVYQAYGMLPT
jgi:hypothetical protein